MSEARLDEPLAIRRYQPGLTAEVAQLHAVLAPGGDERLSARALAWKYAENPYIAEPLIYLAYHEDRLVGMRGFFGAAWEAGGTAAIVPCAADLVVAPAFQDKGVASRIMAAAAADLSARGFSHILSLSAGRVTALGQLTQGFRLVAPMEPLLLGRRSMLERLRAAPAQFTGFDRNGENGDGLVATANPRPSAMAALVESLPTTGRLRQRRDADYFAWRFRNPFSDYRFIYAGEGALQGYIALAIRRNDPASPVWIVDWEAHSEALRTKLLRAAIARGRFRQLGAWQFGLADGGGALLAEAGFMPERDAAALASLRISAMVKPLRDDAALCGRDVLSRAAWDFRMLYSDFC
jgi:GNAT superfamily N-acetyltransferase